MSVITAIAKIRKSQRYEIRFDDDESIEISEGDLSASGAAVGLTVNERTKEDWRKAAAIGLAYDDAARYVLARAKTKSETGSHLRRKGWPTEVIESAVNRLAEAGLVSDIEFAKLWIASRKNHHPRSQWQLVRELKAKGVSSDDIQAGLDELDPDYERQTLERLVQKKAALAQYQDPRKLMAYLVRQGYRYDLVKSVIENQ